MQHQVDREFYITGITTFQNMFLILIPFYSVGVIMFILLSGTFPFNGAGEKIYDVISTGDYTVCYLHSAFMPKVCLLYPFFCNLY